MNAVIYLRSASQEQAEDALAAQRNLCHQYARAHGFTMVAEFAEIAPATTLKRSQFQEMIRFLRQNPDCRVIIVEKTDRICRNLHDFVTIEDLVERRGGRNPFS